MVAAPEAVAAARDGDESAFAVLVEPHRSPQAQLAAGASGELVRQGAVA
jgi:hypothetical protein